MIKKSVTFNRTGSAYSIPEIVQIACRYASRITVTNDHCTFDVKSIMGMMSFDPMDGVITVTADGSDEDEAAAAVSEYFHG